MHRSGRPTNRTAWKLSCENPAEERFLAAGRSARLEPWFRACLIAPGAGKLLSPDPVVSYLVDPASSHMLVSKIKPCMSKYKLLYGETADGSLKQLLFT